MSVDDKVVINVSTQISVNTVTVAKKFLYKIDLFILNYLY